MKKPLAIILLILGGAVAITLIAFATAITFVVMALFIPAEGAWILYTLMAMLLFLISYSFKFPRDFFKNKYNVNAPVFIICVCAPSLIAAEISNLMYTPSISEGSTVDSTAVRLIFWLIITGVFTFWMIVHATVAAIGKHRMKQ